VPVVFDFEKPKAGCLWLESRVGIPESGWF
jgi:hypothetical protein